MRIFWKRWVSLSIFGAVCAAWAATAGAAGIPSPFPTDQISGEFGIMLAEGRASGSSVLDQIGNIAGEPFPWDDGFVFPGSLPEPPTTERPDDLPPEAQAPAHVDRSARAPVPEPEPAILIALGLVSLGAIRRRRSA